MTSSKFEGAVSAVLAVAAIAIAAGVVHRTFFASERVAAAAAPTRPEFLPGWKEALAVGTPVGDSSAPVKIVELADLECRACRSLNGTLQNVLKARAKAASVVFVYFPLPQHRFALSAARGAECARNDGKFREWIDAVYTKQDSLGIKSWGSYARDAGIADTAAIDKCARDPKDIARIQAGIAYGKKIHLAFTPTVIVNGWRFPSTPTEADLLEAIDSLVVGRAPFDTSAV